MEHFIQPIIVGCLILLLLFTITWVIQLRTKNAAIVDSVWAASFPILAVTFALMIDGYAARKLMITSMVIIWGMRLAIYLFTRAIGHTEDARYTTLRKEWGKNENIMMLRFFYFQAILALILSLPFLLIIFNQDETIRLIEILGASIWVVAFLGESVADAQMKNFKANPANKGKVCNQGLWKYSRHPNYFFEWMIWISFFVTALGSPWGFIAITSPVAILYFLLKVTGIPYTEAQLIISKGDAYKKYQQTTSPFFLWPTKANKTLGEKLKSQTS